jgi:hypothetical protein
LIGTRLARASLLTIEGFLDVLLISGLEAVVVSAAMNVAEADSAGCTPASPLVFLGTLGFAIVGTPLQTPKSRNDWID